MSSFLFALFNTDFLTPSDELLENVSCFRRCFDPKNNCKARCIAQQSDSFGVPIMMSLCSTNRAQHHLFPVQWTFTNTHRAKAMFLFVVHRQSINLSNIQTQQLSKLVMKVCKPISPKSYRKIKIQSFFFFFGCHLIDGWFGMGQHKKNTLSTDNLDKGPVKLMFAWHFCFFVERV